MSGSAMYELFWYPGSCARIPFVALEEIGTPFSVSVIEPFDGEVTYHDDLRYRDVNPKGKVPALVAEGRTFTENPALLTYLDARHPEAKLLPERDETARHEALELMSWFAAGVHPPITRQRLPRLFCDEPAAYDSIRAYARAQLEDAFTLIEHRLSDQRWMFGDEWSMVDTYVLWLWFRSTGSGMDGSPFPSCIDHARRCQERPSVATVLDREEAEFDRLKQAGRIPDFLPEYQVGRAPKF